MILVKEWQDKASNKNKKEHNKRYKWCVTKDTKDTKAL